MWVLMGLVVVVVCMSRVYMAAHFPHQVVAGAITGQSGVKMDIYVAHLAPISGMRSGLYMQ